MEWGLAGVRVRRRDVGSQAERAPEEPFRIHPPPPSPAPLQLSAHPGLRGKGSTLCTVLAPGQHPPEGAGVISAGGGADSGGECEVLGKWVWRAQCSDGGHLRDLGAQGGSDGARMPTADWVPLPTLQPPCLPEALFPQLRVLMSLLLVPAGSKTREGVVQGVASGTSPALAQLPSLTRDPEGAVAVEEGTPKNS